MKTGRTVLLAATALAALVAGVVFGGSLIAPSVAQAQNLGMRVVSGSVLAEDSVPVVGATVFLQSEKTKSIRSYTTNDKGYFYFAQVNIAEDFDLWAEKGGKKSATKTVSTWDARKAFVTDLKLK